ncbi:MAG: hypothetical protein ABJG41_20830 [Cyclobacteriaceae bacterium]
MKARATKTGAIASRTQTTIEMKILLTYSYQKNQYELIHANPAMIQNEEIEVLYEFELRDMRIAQNILANFNRQRMLNTSAKAA